MGPPFDRRRRRASLRYRSVSAHPGRFSMLGALRGRAGGLERPPGRRILGKLAEHGDLGYRLWESRARQRAYLELGVDQAMRPLGGACGTLRQWKIPLTPPTAMSRVPAGQIPMSNSSSTAT